MEERRQEFEEIALSYIDSLYRGALRMSQDETEALDLVQDTYLRAWRFFGKFKKGTDCKAWLFRILKNVYINKFRKRVKQPLIVSICDAGDAEGLLAPTTPEDEVFKDLLDDEITSALDQLPDHFRLTIVLSDIEGFAYKEIAEILEIPIGTVMSRLHRGRKLLRIKLYQYAKNLGYVA